jgi:hypothetical protein
LRLVVLALLAPAFAVPSAALASAAVDDPGRAPAAAGSVATVDHVGHAARHALHRIHAPRKVNLLAARVYWGARPPARPSTRSLRHELRQTARYYRHVSHGRERVHVRLTRWVRTRASGDVMCNTQGRSAAATKAALRRAGYHPARFNRLMILTEQCESAASVAQLPGRVTWIRFRAPGMATLVHELGHNLGLGHAYGLVCHQGGRRVALVGARSPGAGCRPVEYGDSWDAMGHSRGFFSAPTLVRLGWAGRVAHVHRSGTYTLADVEHARSADQALRVRAGRTTYWVEYQREHSPQVGRTIPGVMIRRQVGHGPVEMIDASPGNPTGIAYPDRDLTNSALPVGSSLTTPGHRPIRFTTVAAGRRARVKVTFGAHPSVPDPPALSVTQSTSGYRVRWTAPQDHGQIVLGYRITAWASDGTSQGSTFVRSPGGYRRSVALPPAKDPTQPPTFTVKALNQQGWSRASAAVAPSAQGPNVRLTSPASWSYVTRSFDVRVSGTPAEATKASPAGASAKVGPYACTTDAGPGPYLLHCDDTGLSGTQFLVVHVSDAGGNVTTVTIPVRMPTT